MRQQIYNWAASLLPRPKMKEANDVQIIKPSITPASFVPKLLHVFEKHRVYGCSFALFNQDGISLHVTYGQANKENRVTPETFFRVASVSKMITAACVMRLHQEGILNIDDDVRPYLPKGETIKRPITLRGMMTHTAGFRDGPFYHRLVGTSAVTDDLMQDENTQPEVRHPSWEYSNLGAGLIAIVLESMMDKSFEIILQEHLFKPLQIQASFYPQHIPGSLADAYQVFPFNSTPRFNASERMARSDEGWNTVDVSKHYTLAQGNCCTDMKGMVAISQALMIPGFLKDKTLKSMQRVYATFGVRDTRLRQGIGLFIVKDTSLAPQTLYGHQGLAYGAVHGAFFDVEQKNGFAFMTSGASLAKRGVLTEVNADLIRLWQTIV